MERDTPTTEPLSVAAREAIRLANELDEARSLGDALAAAVAEAVIADTAPTPERWAKLLDAARAWRAARAG